MLKQEAQDHFAGKGYTGADLVAAFVAQHCHSDVFLVTGGACAFIVDALSRNPDTDYVCFQHEQAAAMAADAVWRLSGRMGVTVATSGPGATNLITGIACSWFDSIPALHITGQVNDAESREKLGVSVRQAGFQETDIVDMVRSITKFARRVHAVDELVSCLREAARNALEGRMGPVLVDVPMNVQKELVSRAQWELALSPIPVARAELKVDWDSIQAHFEGAKRPLVVIGAGAVLSSSVDSIQNWCDSHGIPYVSSWGAMPHIDRSRELYLGSQGVYGGRLANWGVQAADFILVLGSRLDNRQRSGDPTAYAPFAKILVIDIDGEELGKFRSLPNYRVVQADLSTWDHDQRDRGLKRDQWKEWRDSLRALRETIDPGTSVSVSDGQLSPYEVVREIQRRLPEGAIVVSDCGANLCWVYQGYLADSSFLFTAAGNSPMGYSLPASIGAQLTRPEASVTCFIGDGGLQMNIQELQTIVHYGLPIKIVIMNNRGYGIIKQFQDSYFGGRHEASGQGYSLPSFERVASAYQLAYFPVEVLSDLDAIDFSSPNSCVIDVSIPPGALITPKLEVDHFLHDQFPYAPTIEGPGLPYRYPGRPSDLHSGAPSPNV